MEHYYVVNGNEYGVDLGTKKNFTNIKDAKNHFEEVKYDDFGCKLVYVNSSGVEKDIEIFIND
jgi:hypothetical protein